MAQQPQQWYYRKGNARSGPINSAELKRKAGAGEILPADLVRMVGLTEWIPASNVKGLFPTPTPPSPTLPASQPVVAKPTPRATPNLAPKPTPPQVQPPPPTPPDPVVSVPNPFAETDPFAALGPPAAAGGGFDLSNLVALEKQSEAIYREPVAVPESTTGNKQSKDDETETASLGAAGKIGLLLAPFGAMLGLAYVCGVVYALMHLFIIHLMALIFSVIFSVTMSTGLTRMVGLFAGNCLRKVNVKNEVLSLAYGGMIGLFGAYVLMAGYIWAVLQFNPFQGVFDDTPIIELTEEEAEGDIRLDLFGGEGDAIDAMDEFRAKMKEKERRDMKRDSGVLAEERFQIKISFFGSFSPLWVLVAFAISWWFWLIHGPILLCSTAHSTWMSNLGYDPTRQSGF